MTNILEAICNIVEQSNFNIKHIYSGRNRANSVGEALENYIKDAFANTLGETNELIIMKKYNSVFSWLGSQNNPPDIMIKKGDAIEVKKTQSPNSDLALNSSYPKSSLLSTSPMITKECKKCEDWNEKDLIYCVGHTNDDKLNSLWMVYGSIYAANHKIYDRIKSTISAGIRTIQDVEFSDSKELGRVNRVDPLGITNLRIRGMWQILNPRNVFKYLHTQGINSFELVCIVPLDKYSSFEKSSIERIEKINHKGFTIENAEVKDPNNPAKLIDVKVIKYIL